jgi:hypothetical protein
MAFTRTCTPSLNLVQGERRTSPCRFCDVPLLLKERDVLAKPKQGEVMGKALQLISPKIKHFLT